ncbi:MAG: WD40 repeat domain-containing protein [Pirellulaceae bacterium]|nr:WD40 repeat domain-containing protein [Pirellulaceae bacterium]
MVISPAIRCLKTVSLGIVISVSGLAASPVAAQSVNWSNEIIELQPARSAGARPVAVAVTLDPAGRRLAIAGDDHAIRVWHLADQRVIQRLVGHTDWVRSLCFSSDGSQLASAGNDGRVLLWSDETSQPLRELMHGDGALSAVAFRPGTSQLACVGFNEPLRFFDTRTGERLLELQCPCNDMRAIAFSPTANLMAGGGRNGKIRIWEPASGKIRGETSAHRLRIRDLTFSPDGNWLASCSDDRRVRIASVNGSDEFMFPRGTAKVMSVAFVGPNRLATGGSDNVIRIWDLDTRQEVAKLFGHTGSVMALVYRGETLISAGFDATVRIWRLQNSATREVQTPSVRIGRTEIFENR